MSHVILLLRSHCLLSVLIVDLYNKDIDEICGNC